MIKKLEKIHDIVTNMGIVYVFFRISYEIKRKLGWHKTIFPTNPEPKNYISLGI